MPDKVLKREELFWLERRLLSVITWGRTIVVLIWSHNETFFASEFLTGKCFFPELFKEQQGSSMYTPSVLTF